MTIDLRHAENAKKARDLYLDNLNPAEAAADWRFAIREARKQVGAALKASNYMTDIEAALVLDGAHTLVFRQMLAPPMSQDQFKLVCADWSKQWEKTGRPVQHTAANAVAAIISERLARLIHESDVLMLADVA